jgi:hypothetical protein
MYLLDEVTFLAYLDSWEGWGVTRRVMISAKGVKEQKFLPNRKTITLIGEKVE